jgi:hypothetical protein
LVTPASHERPCTTIGELQETIKANWTASKTFSGDVVALEKVMSPLNVPRAPVAHCKRLAEH